MVIQPSHLSFPGSFNGNRQGTGGKTHCNHPTKCRYTWHIYTYLSSLRKVQTSVPVLGFHLLLFFSSIQMSCRCSYWFEVLITPTAPVFRDFALGKCKLLLGLEWKEFELESLVYVITDWYLLPFQPCIHQDGDILPNISFVTPILHVPLWSNFMHFSLDWMYFF